MKKIVITRPVEGASSTIELAQQLGFSALSFPLLKLTALNNSTLSRSMDHYNWLLFTSSNGVRFFIDYCSKNRISLAQQFKIAAIGPSTEKSLQGFGLKADFVPAIFNRTAISEQMPVNKGDTILYPTILDGPEKIENILIRRECFIDRLDVYQSTPVIYDPDEWKELAKTQPDVITFFSPRTVHAFFKNRQQAVHLEEYVIAVLAQGSAEELSKLGYVVHIKTDIPVVENLLQNIKEYYA